jgi:hypothetical protein
LEKGREEEEGWQRWLRQDLERKKLEEENARMKREEEVAL